jgi:hypothetical protein
MYVGSGYWIICDTTFRVLASKVALDEMIC